MLRLESRPIDGAAIQARRSAGLQALPFQAQRAELIAQKVRRRLAASAATILLLADVRQPIQERAGCDHDRVALDRPAVAQQDALEPAWLESEITSCATSACRIRRFGSFSRISRILQPILFLVALRARRPHRRPAAGIQQPKLDADGVRDLAHHAAQRVDLANQMALGDSADRRIARHLRDQVQIHRDHRRLQAQTGARARRFAAGVSGADDDHFITICHVLILSWHSNGALNCALHLT